MLLSLDKAINLLLLTYTKETDFSSTEDFFDLREEKKDWAYFKKNRRTNENVHLFFIIIIIIIQVQFSGMFSIPYDNAGQEFYQSSQMLMPESEVMYLFFSILFWFVLNLFTKWNDYF